MIQEHYGVLDPDEVILKIVWDDLRRPLPPLDQYIKFQLPYEAPKHPGIPSIEEIEKGIEEIVPAIVPDSLRYVELVNAL